MVDIQFSEKNKWRSSQLFVGKAFPKFQENRSSLSNLTGCGYLTPQFNISVLHILLKDLISKRKL